MIALIGDGRHISGGGLAVVLLLALMAIPSAGATIPPSAAPVLLPEVLPSATYAMGSVWTGTVAYVFGGWLASEVVRYDPLVGGAAVVAQLAPGNQFYFGPAVAWTGSAAYLLGGSYSTGGGDPMSYGIVSNEIQRFDPATNSVVTLSSTILGRAQSAAVYINGEIFIFGGWDNTADKKNTQTCQADIVRFTVSTEVAETLSTALPTPSCVPWAVTDGTYAYVGGLGAPDNALYRFDPATNALTAMPITMPGGPADNEEGASAVMDGTSIYLFGGSSLAKGYVDGLDRIIRVDLAAGTATVLPQPLPHAMFFSSAINHGCGATIFGGFDRITDGVGWVMHDSIIRFGNPYPCKPTPSFTVEEGPQSCTAATFTFTSTTKPAALIASQTWDFGDAAIASGAMATHTYTTSGIYTVTLTVTDPDGVAWTAQQDVFANIPTTCPPTIEEFPLQVVEPGSFVQVCAVAHPGMGGTLSFVIGAAPGAVDAVTGCWSWTAFENAGQVPCVWVQVTEAPSGQSAGACLRIRVTHTAGGVGAAPRPDVDSDGVEDAADNCPAMANHEQDDTDWDGVGDVCDATKAPGKTGTAPQAGVAANPRDSDRDGTPDEIDNCPDHANVDQANVDHDTLGDSCDPDLDGDGVADQAPKGSFLDNCPRKPNANQADANDDGVGDACQGTVNSAAAGNAPAHSPLFGTVGPMKAADILLYGGSTAIATAALLLLVLRRRQ